MVTTWSWLTAAAAWASRAKRLRAVALVASCGGHDLDGHDAVQLVVERPQHHPHAALADDFENLVMTQAAERTRRIRRRQEVQLRVVTLRCRRKVDRRRVWEVHKAAELLVLGQQGLHALPQCGVPGAGRIEPGGPVGGIGLVQRSSKDFTLGHGVTPWRK